MTCLVLDNTFIPKLYDTDCNNHEHRSEVFCQKVFFKISQISSENTCVGVSFNKVAGLQANFIKKRLQHRCFLVKFTKFLRTSFLKNICKRRPLNNLNIPYSSLSSWYI